VKQIVVICAAVAGFVLLLAIAFIGFHFWLFVRSGDQSLAKNLAITNDWAEIDIQPPVRPTYREQAIYLRPVDFKVDRDAKGFEVRLPDGTVVEPTVEIVDDHGNVFQLHKSGFAMGRNDYVEFTPGSDSKHFTELSPKRKYSKVRIRSDVPFVCESVRWIDYDPK